MISAPNIDLLFANQYPHLDHFKQYFQQKYGDSLLAIIFYGSCVNLQTISPTSSPDFYLLVSDYKKAHNKIVHRLLNKILPPNIYFLTVSSKFCKYNTISQYAYLKETTGNSGDIYNLGRLSKRFAVIYYKDQQIRETISNAYLATTAKVIKLALPLLAKEFSLEELIKKALALSYLGEKRVEADDKVDRLYQAAAEFYREIYQSQLISLIDQKKIPYSFDRQQQLIKYLGNRLARKMAASNTLFFLWQSKLRTVIRWFKYAFILENWVDYLLAKIERTKGIKLELTEKEKKYPLIFGWKYLWQLSRKGYFK